MPLLLALTGMSIECLQKCRVPATTNGSTQHERNTAFPASFTSNLDPGTCFIAVQLQGVSEDADTLGLIAVAGAGGGSLHCRQAAPVQEAGTTHRILENAGKVPPSGLLSSPPI
jgi:hypothetical protein